MTWYANPKQNRAYEAGEVVKIRWEALPYTTGVGLDIGCGAWRLWPSSIGVDRGGKGANLKGDVAHLDLTADGCMDYVFSSHCLEDLKDTEAVLREWWRVIKPGGHLVLYLPHAEMYPRRGSKGANPAHAHDFMPDDIVKAMKNAAPDWALLENQERGDGDEYSFLQVYRKRKPGAGQGVVQMPPLHKRCVVIRYGGFGDALIASSTFPHLKDQGWHLTVIASPKGKEILAFDPHVDRLVGFDHGWMRMDAMRAQAEYYRETQGKAVNFSETFESLLLADPRRPNYWWPHEMRQKYMNGNYLEAAHAAADVPQEYLQRFHETDAERIWAADWRKSMDRLVVIAASGTGANKFWPGVFEYAWRLVKRNEGLHVAVIGDLLGGSFLEHERLHVLGVNVPVRRSFALAKAADLVIGQETGSLNAVAFSAMPKIVLLSHSSVENLTKHWMNTYTLAGDVPCFPCHRLHAEWDGCNQDPETKLAACQTAIKPMAAIDLTEQLLGIERRAAA